MIKISPLIGNLFAMRRFLTYSYVEAKESMDNFAPSERGTTTNSNIFESNLDQNQQEGFRTSINDPGSGS
jgi:hypothetical protein|tara:strand:+ start:961 stop:1170 length:210 start_codon:yes stop_codon:yes gene_type:complete